ncbi:MAG: hypothetical protein WAV28_00095 [Sedimentisphaerales bacterium]|jgi:hypothetical protein
MQALTKYFRVWPGRLAGAMLGFRMQSNKKPKTGILSDNPNNPALVR